MTSISAASSSSYQSPLQLLQAELKSEVNSGSISSWDQSALSSALNDINSSLQGGGADGSTGSNAQPSSAAPGDIKSKIDSLIAGEVSSGKLTAQQATELQGVFQNAFAGGANGSSGTGSTDASAAIAALGAPPSTGGPGGSGGVHHGHHGGGGGHHGGAPSASSSSTSTSSSSSTSGSSGSSSPEAILQQFLQSLQSSLSDSSAAGYGANGSSTSASDSSSSFSALLINYET
jgi:hypothetical protein